MSKATAATAASAAATATGPSSFKAAYDILQKNAEILRSQREPDLDGLLKLVQESMAAYAVCKEKIESVEKALEATLAAAEGDESTPF